MPLLSQYIKGNILSDSNSVIFWKSKTLKAFRRLTVAKGWGSGVKMNRWTTDDF